MKKSTKLVVESCGSYPNGREFVHVYIEYPDGKIESLGLSRAFSFGRGIKLISKSAPPSQTHEHDQKRVIILAVERLRNRLGLGSCSPGMDYELVADAFRPAV